jgi:hypothetical protein
MLIRPRLFISASALLLITACGGGEEGGYTPLSFGSIAVNKTTGAAGITANYTTQKEANTAAVATCGQIGCETVLEFGSYQCAALARATNRPTFGWASDNRLSDAKSKAVNQCTQLGGVGCTVVLDKCNSS